MVTNGHWAYHQENRKNAKQTDRTCNLKLNARIVTTVLTADILMLTGYTISAKSVTSAFIRKRNKSY
jgi:hypothetical protein